MSTPSPVPGEASRPPATNTTYPGLTDEQTIEITAITQAAHAVIGAVWGFNITETRIYQVADVPGGIGYSGTTDFAQSRIPWLEGIAHMNAAGDAAVRQYLDRSGLPDPHRLAGVTRGRQNRERAEEQLAARGFTMVRGAVPAGVPGASWDAVVQQVDRTLEQLWPQVEEVASQLRTSFAVSGDHVRSILGDAASEIDLAVMADASRQAPEPRGGTFQRLMDLARQIAADGRLRAPRGPGRARSLPDAQFESLQSQQQQHGRQHLR
ncbi:hypothetical protein [Streptomyces lydicus]|uniref:hypothetical protein n=1 Tax=Streptomyces lydicus TaxID=47763 RepID=UPI00101296A9|nr:hypothetical protein [Streptomyces lydicus]MCZ1011876.1 hypothetical protein [Streptomyces lydicus]